MMKGDESYESKWQLNISLVQATLIWIKQWNMISVKLKKLMKVKWISTLKEQNFNFSGTFSN